MTKLDDIIADSIEKSKAKSKPKSTVSLDPVEGFITSVGSSAFEFFGAEPLAGAEDFRANNPKAGLVSELASPLGLYGAAAKAPKAIKGFGKLIDNIGDVKKSPISTFAKRGVATFAPLEAARVAGTAIQNPENLGDAVKEGAVNLALEAAGGGIYGIVKGAGRRQKALKDVYNLDAGIDLKQAPQFRHRELAESLLQPDLDTKKVAVINGELKTFEKAIREEALEPAVRYVKNITEGSGQAISRVFKGRNSKRFIASGKDFKDSAARDVALDAAGIKDKIQFTQYPRFIEATDIKQAKAIEANLIKQGKMQTVAPNLLMVRENDGMFVLAKKLEGKIGEKTATDKWAVWKTDKPSEFSEELQKFSDVVVDKSSLSATPKYTPQGLDVYDDLHRTDELLPLEGYADAARTGKLKQFVDGSSKRLGLEGENELTASFKESLRTYFTPAMFQFNSSPRAKRLHGLFRSTHETAARKARQLIFGDELLKADSNLFKASISRAAFKDEKTLAGMLSRLSGVERDDLVAVSRAAMSAEDVWKRVASGESTENLAKVVDKLSEVDDYVVDQIVRTQKLTGVQELKQLKSHLMLSRTWEGSNRVAIRNEADKVVYVASGKQAKIAEDLAEDIVQKAKAEGIELKRDAKAQIYDTDADMDLAMQLNPESSTYLTAAGIENKIRRDSRPKQFQKRSGVEGYQTEFTNSELVDKLNSHLQSRFRYLADISTQHKLQPELMKLGLENPKIFKDLMHRVRTMAGVQGEFAQKQNQALDAVLGSALDKNSASKIVSTLNGTMHVLQFGMMNVGFALLNATTFMQTVLPEVAFAMSAGKGSLQKHYTWLPAIGSDGNPRGSVGVLDMFKLMKTSFKNMGSPDADLVKLYSRGVSDGVVDPKFLEEYVGATSQRVVRMKDALSGKEPFSKWLLEVSNFMPVSSEKFARGHAFTTGHMMGKDHFNLAGDDLYRFAKEFTEKTMFNYSTADRAKVMTAPLGSMFGLFKNWQTHYLASMFEYMGEGYSKGNWNPLLWQMGGTAAVGGVAATPLYSSANAMSQWLSDEPLMNHIYEISGGNIDSTTGGISDALYQGLPSMLGLSLSGQTSMPLSDPARDAGMLFSFVHWNRAQAAGRTVGSAFDHWSTTGEHPFASQKVRDQAIQAFAPKTFARAASIVQGDAIKSLKTGDLLLKDLNTAETMMHTLGLTSRRVALSHAVNEELFKNKTAMQNKVKAYGQAWSEMQEDRDYNGLQELRKKAFVEGVDISSILRSSQTRLDNKKNTLVDRKYKESDLFRFKDLDLIQ